MLLYFFNLQIMYNFKINHFLCESKFCYEFKYMRILQTRTTDCLKLPSYFLRTVQNKTTKTLETYQFSTFNFMYKVCVYILYEGHLSLCINIIQTNFTVLYTLGCRYINKLARRNVAIFVCFVHTYQICIIAFLAFS